MSEPTYDALKQGRQPGRGKWQIFLRTMEPGDFKKIPLAPTPRAADHARSALRSAAKSLDLAIAVRTHEGELYAVYLKPEDVHG